MENKRGIMNVGNIDILDTHDYAVKCLDCGHVESNQEKLIETNTHNKCVVCKGNNLQDGLIKNKYNE